ncbi:MAG: DMT family transporter [Pseudomonadota bacterium]
MARKDLEQPALEPENLALGVLYGGLAALAWGLAPVVMRFSVQHDMAPGDVVAVRFAVSGILLLPVVLRRGSGGIGWLPCLLLTCGAGAPVLLITIIGLTMAPAGHEGVINASCTLLFSAAGAWWLLHDRPDGTRLAGLAVIVLGIALIGWDSLSDFGLETLEGDLIFVGSGFLWAVYTLTARVSGVQPLQAAALVAVISSLFYLPLYLLFGEPGLLDVPAWEIAMVAVAQGVLSGILAILFYTRAIHMLGAGRAAVFNAMVPVLVLIIAYPTLGEVPTWLELLGVAIVTLGMVAALGLLRARRAE